MNIFLYNTCHSIFRRRTPLIATLFLIFLLFMSSPASAAKVLIVGDIRYALVADVAAEIQLTVRSQTRQFAVSDIKGQLHDVVEREAAVVVVALGSDAVAEALRLPPDISVVYGLVTIPPRTNRANITGVYMSPPVSEYVATVRRYLPGLARLSIVGSQSMLKNLNGSDHAHTSIYNVASSADLLNTVNRLTDTRALLLLPDTNLLTAQVMSSLYLFSFKKNIPLLGISEASVKQGALFALVFDHKTVSRQIGAKVQKILSGVEAEELQDSPPGRYNLYINAKTAEKMGIEIPDEMLRKAKRVY